MRVGSGVGAVVAYANGTRVGASGLFFDLQIGLTAPIVTSG